MKPEVATQRWKLKREFKLETMKLVSERAVSTAQAARDLFRMICHLRRTEILT
jgi:hypothetical protein